MVNSKCNLSNIEALPQGKIGAGCYLVLFRATDVPPHLYLIVGSSIFTLEVSGVRVAEPVDRFMRLIQQKQIASLFVELKLPLIFDINEIHANCVSILSGYDSVAGSGITCLAPIKDFCAETYNIETSSVQFIFDLIPLLEKQVPIISQKALPTIFQSASSNCIRLYSTYLN